MNEKKIKESFRKAREDIDFLKDEIGSLKEEMSFLRDETSRIVDILHKLVENKTKNTDQASTDTSTHRHQNPTTSTDTSTHRHALKPLKHQNMGISTRNEGASTDRQTDRQTNRHTPISSGESTNMVSREPKEQTPISSPFLGTKETDSIDNAAKILDSLDGIKKEVRLKFKRLTDQELLVFSTLYQLDEEEGHADYKTLANKLNLTESSIRDYVGRLIKKGIPVEKRRVNNKFIHLKISENLKKIASLPTILQLRDL